MPNPTRSEKVGPNFSSEKLLKVRDLTWSAVYQIRDAIRPGMTEDEAIQSAKDILKKMQSEKNWHRVYVRFGVNTTLMYGEPSTPVVLGENDIFFVDIGPVWDGMEGDAGETFVIGQDEEMRRCAEDAKVLFEVVKKKWQDERLTGSDLYEFAQQESLKRGWIFHHKVNGHRISDFPHMIYHRGHLGDAKFSPTPELWVLEIQIRHPERPFGAFYEDVLI